MDPKKDEPASSALAARRIGHYLLVEKIGQGGMGEVYLAEDTVLRRRVALKLPLHWIQSDPSTRRRFVNEARAAAAIDHPYVCKVFDVSEVADCAFIAMEYVEGRTLKSLLSEKLLSLEQVLHFSLEIAEALAKAHEIGIIHRDVKPSNIMQTREDHIKVMDFGLAIRIPRRARRQADTSTESDLSSGRYPIAGTVSYMSPEQINAIPLDRRSDVFSFGVVLYEMLFGIHPFRRNTPIATAGAILSAAPNLEDSRRESYPVELKNLVLKMLEKERKRRPQCHDVVARLKSISRAAWKSTYNPESNSVAVLPFVDLSAPSIREYFADGVTEELIMRLSQIPGLRVISRTSAMHYRRTKKDLRTIGRELDVGSVIEGSVRRVEDRVRIVSKLVEVETERQVWSEVFERDIKDVIAVQSEVAERIAARLVTNPAETHRQELSRSGTKDPQAYTLYLKGRYFMNKMSHQDLQKAIGYFRETLDRDPVYAQAYAGLSSCYANLDHLGYAPSHIVYPRAKAAAEEALVLDSNLAEAHTSMGYVLFHEWDWEHAQYHFKRAIRINPNYSDARIYYSWLLVAFGNWEEALEEGTEARRTDPLSFLAGLNLGWLHLCVAHYRQGVEELERTLELAPGNPQAQNLIAVGLLGLGKHEQAIDLLEKSAWLKPMLGWAYAMVGRTNEARRVLDEVTLDYTAKYHSPAQIGLIHFFLGETKDGVRWLEEAYARKDPQLIHLRANHFVIDAFRDPGVEAIFERIGLEPSIDKLLSSIPKDPQTDRIFSCSQRNG